MYCSNCGNELQNGAKFCSECGEKVDRQGSSKSNSNNICPSCGSTMKREWIKDENGETIGSRLYCAHCDRDEIEKNSEKFRLKMLKEHNRMKEKKNDNNMMLLLIIISVIMIAIGVLGQIFGL